MGMKRIQSKIMPVDDTEPEIRGEFQFNESITKNHSEPGSYICKKCGACFTSNRGIKQHMSLKHTEKTPLLQKNKPSRIRDPLILSRNSSKKQLTFDEDILDALKHGYSELENAGKLGGC